MKLNIHFFVVFIVACIATINDLLIYFLGIEYELGFYISSIIIAVISFLLIKKKIINITFDFSKYDIFLCVAMVFITLTSGIVYPDYTYDVRSYHIYIQENPFIDKINFDFFPARIYCICLFALGDRMFYIFRYFLGYRMGAILSFYLAFVVYYQVKRILLYFGNSKTKSSLFANLIFLVYTFACNIGNYYIDNLAMVFLLEAVIIVLTNKEIFKKKSILFILSLIIGFSIGIKITSCMFAVPILIYLIIKNKDSFKYLKIHVVIICGLLVILPFFVYMLDNYKQTGSILFPYYNTYLKSEYFEQKNWKDRRFGIDGIINKIIWPVKVNTLIQYGDDSHSHDYTWVFGYIFAIAYLVKKCINKDFKSEKMHLAILSLVLTAIWVLVLEGYMRYGVLIPILWTILIIDSLAKRTNIDCTQYSKILYIFTIISIVFVGSFYMLCLLDINNIKYIFSDIEKNQSPIHIDGVWGTTYDFSGFAALVREEGTPIYTLDKGYFGSNEKTLSMWNEKISNKDIYVIVDDYTGNLEKNKKIKFLKRNHFEIVEFVKTYTADEIPYINANGVWHIVKVRYAGE